MSENKTEVIDKPRYIYNVTPNYQSSFNIKEKTLEYEIYLPGVKKENIKFKILRDMFDLKADIDEGSKYSLSLYFPYDIEENNIEATYENGLLKFKAGLRDPLKEAYELKLE